MNGPAVREVKHQDHERVAVDFKHSPGQTKPRGKIGLGDIDLYREKGRRREDKARPSDVQIEILRMSYVHQRSFAATETEAYSC
jgi:hypothetical protein